MFKDALLKMLCLYINRGPRRHFWVIVIYNKLELEHKKPKFSEIIFSYFAKLRINKF